MKTRNFYKKNRSSAFQCKPGTHIWFWDEEENRNRFDGGNYYKCSKCGDLAGDINAIESWSQFTTRVEKQTVKELKRRLMEIR